MDADDDERADISFRRHSLAVQVLFDGKDSVIYKKTVRAWLQIAPLIACSLPLRLHADEKKLPSPIQRQ